MFCKNERGLLYQMQMLTLLMLTFVRFDYSSQDLKILKIVFFLPVGVNLLSQFHYIDCLM